MTENTIKNINNSKDPVLIVETTGDLRINSNNSGGFITKANVESVAIVTAVIEGNYDR